MSEHIHCCYASNYGTITSNASQPKRRCQGRLQISRWHSGIGPIMNKHCVMGKTHPTPNTHFSHISLAPSPSMSYPPPHNMGIWAVFFPFVLVLPPFPRIFQLLQLSISREKLKLHDSFCSSMLQRPTVGHFCSYSLKSVQKITHKEKWWHTGTLG